jgi:hypothetical protein
MPLLVDAERTLLRPFCSTRTNLHVGMLEQYQQAAGMGTDKDLSNGVQ